MIPTTNVKMDTCAPVEAPLPVELVVAGGLVGVEEDEDDEDGEAGADPVDEDDDDDDDDGATALQLIWTPINVEPSVILVHVAPLPATVPLAIWVEHPESLNA